MAFDKLIWEYSDHEAQEFFAYAGYKARNLRTPLQRAGSALLHHINLTFATEGRAALQAWPPLARGYAQQKLKEWGDRPLLVASGQMRSKAISRQRLRVSGDELVYSMTSPAFAVLHQEGGEGGVTKDGRPFQRPPRRAFVVITPSLVDSIEHVFAEWLEDLKGMNRRRRDIDLPNPAFG